MKQIKAFETTDGKQFFDEKEAKAHQLDLIGQDLENQYTIINKGEKDHDKRCNILNHIR